MSFSVGNNYTNPYSSGSSNVNRTSGFDVGKIAGIQIKSADLKKFGIAPEDFAKVDTDEDGSINASEFLSAGINISSIFNAYKAQATRIDGAFLPEGSEPPQNKQNNLNQNSLERPSVANHPHLAKNLDLSA